MIPRLVTRLGSLLCNMIANDRVSKINIRRTWPSLLPTCRQSCFGRFYLQRLPQTSGSNLIHPVLNINCLYRPLNSCSIAVGLDKHDRTASGIDGYAKPNQGHLSVIILAPTTCKVITVVFYAALSWQNKHRTGL